MDEAHLNHKLIPQRNINVRFNLCDTPHYVCFDNHVKKLDDVYFSGLQNKFINTNLKLDGKVDILGVCFEADGIYPFLKMPVSEFKNQVLGALEIGFKIADQIKQQIREATCISSRLNILEKALLTLINDEQQLPENFRMIFNALKHEKSLQLNDFCEKHNISIRQLERMYLRYVGLSANTYATLNRFHDSMNQILNSRYKKLSDLAYDNEYFDQMHFIKDFKRFTGNSPREFIQENKSILQIGKLT